MPAPIRVLLDVAQFGQVLRTPHLKVARTGIHRVIDRTVEALRTSPEVALSLCAPGPLGWDAVDYLRTHPDFRALPFRPARKAVTQRLRARARERHTGHGAPPPSSLPLRAASTLLFQTNRVIDAWSRAQWSVERLRTDVYHSPVFALPRRRAPRVRYVLTVYDLIPLLMPEMSWVGAGEWLGNVLASVGPDDHVLAISERTRDDLLDAYPVIAPERVHVTPLAADERFYPCDDAGRRAAARAKYGVPDAPYVLSVATLEPRKNTAHLIRTWAELVRAERLDDLHLVLTGERGWKSDGIFAASGELADLRDRIVFTGYVDDADLAPLYSGALAFAYPSLYEGFGLPPLEAMQCGTPVVTSNVASLPEVVGDAGFMVDPADGAALAQALLALYRDSALRADASARGLARARQFTWARYAERCVAGYRAALAGA